MIGFFFWKTVWNHDSLKVYLRKISREPNWYKIVYSIVKSRRSRTYNELIKIHNHPFSPRFTQSVYFKWIFFIAASSKSFWTPADRKVFVWRVQCISLQGTLYTITSSTFIYPSSYKKIIWITQSLMLLSRFKEI